eukprot:CAMPEP_0185028680 /NCGR_PEP_ID=MMETSP1103-20130426/14581_1 /TAXON_ID=36769 /ORGANISM="Paraphysomonas bandaiensis, Strain Caron Lab Isolate" /LENGTH=229 /DNA_ID=CAMNT_0027563175 /DNA_START=87 /DNA_END=772 /DNA_ORIENTATION=-
MSVSTPSKPKKRPAENNGPDTPSKYRKTELNTDQEKFTNSRMFDKPGVGRILDRRVSLNMLNDSSLYSILRAWVYDNPEIEQPQASQSTPRTSSNNDVSTDYDDVIRYLEQALKPKKASTTGGEIRCVNTLDGISSADILSLHVLYYKKIRRIWRMLAASRYARLKVRGQKLSPTLELPSYDALEALLKRNPGDEFCISHLQDALKTRNNEQQERDGSSSSSTEICSDG